MIAQPRPSVSMSIPCTRRSSTSEHIVIMSQPQAVAIFLVISEAACGKQSPGAIRTDSQVYKQKELGE